MTHQTGESALAMIGNTPLIELARLHRGPGRLFAKAEFVQPGGSVKDRAALRIVEDAYASGKLAAGQPVVELTSGNMGAGLAVVCAIKGNPFYAVMSEGNSPERRRMLEGLGARLLLVPQVDGVPGQVTGADLAAVEKAALELVETEGGFYADQFNNPSGLLAHEETTGPELWEALGGRIDAFVATVGTGCTFVGTSRFLKRKNPGLLCVVVEPEGAEILAGKPVTKPRHMIQGTGYGLVPHQWEPKLADRYLSVTDEAAAAMKKRLAHEEGLFVGFSAAANVAAALDFLHSCEGPRADADGPAVVTILCDTGLKYS